MTATEPLPTDRLAELIAAKEQVLALLVGLARRQLDLASTGEMSGLLKLLAAKQTVLAQLQQLERNLDPFREENPERRAWRSPQDRSRSQEAARRCEQLLAETMRLERQGEAAMVLRRDAAATTLDGLHAAADVHTAYMTADASSAPARLYCEG